MSLVVEDGTGKANAESYFAIADADAYFSARGNTTWAELDTTAKESAARNGTEFISEQFDGQWIGTRATTTQALAWPRLYAALPDTMFYLPQAPLPTLLMRGTMEAALLASSGDLYASPTQATFVTGLEEGLGTLTRKTTYGKLDFDPSKPVIRGNKISNILAPLLMNDQVGTGSLNLVRA